MKGFLVFPEDADHLYEIMVLSKAGQGVGELLALAGEKLDEEKKKSIAYLLAMLFDAQFELAGKMDT